MKNAISILALVLAVLALGVNVFQSEGGNLGALTSTTGSIISAAGFTTTGTATLTTTSITTDNVGTLSVTTAGGIKKFTEKGSVLSTTTPQNTLLTAADVAAYTRIELANTTAAGTITTAASSTFTSIIATAGDRYRMSLCNASSTAALTLAGGTGFNLYKIGTTTGVIAPSKCSLLTFEREPDTDITLYFSGTN